MNSCTDSACDDGDDTELEEVVPNTRILIVDDDDMLRGLMESILSFAGYGTECAADGEEALALLGVAEFDILLTDCKMPRLDGVGLTRALRAAGNLIPIMMYSSSLSPSHELPPDIRDEISVALPKPATTRQILNSIAQTLRKASATSAKPRIAAIQAE